MEGEDRGSSIELQVTLQFRDWVNKEDLIYIEKRENQGSIMTISTAWCYKSKEENVSYIAEGELEQGTFSSILVSGIVHTPKNFGEPQGLLIL